MAKTIQKFGRNTAVGNGVWEDVWENGGIMFWPQDGQVLHVFSSTAADTSTGLGARSVTVHGLSTSFAEIEETIDTAGTSTSVGSKKFQRVNRAFVEDSGAYGGTVTGGNRGTITINTATGAAMATIGTTTGSGTLGEGQTQIARYTVPKDKTGYVRSVHLSVDSLKPADIVFFQRQRANVVSAPFGSPRAVLDFDVVTGTEDYRPVTPSGPYPEMTDLWWAAKGEGNATEVDVDFEILLYRQGQEPEFG